jgi:DNA-3-methyladenine glycosylase II
MEKIVLAKDDLAALQAKDQRMADLVDYLGEIERTGIPDPFLALVRNIVFQQLSGTAADSIWQRLQDELGVVTADRISKISAEELLDCGLSNRKVTYLKELSIAVVDGDFKPDQLKKLNNQQIIEELVKLKGIGVWTAEMFLIFSLNRQNVISYNDLGIRKGIQWFEGLNSEPSKKQFNKFKQKFTPYNTLASFYLWEATSLNLPDKFASPGELFTKNKVAYYNSPLGLIEIQAADQQIVSLQFQPEQRYQEDLVPVIEKAQQQLEEYFAGERKYFELPLKLKGTDFQKQVWQQLQQIPYGTTRAYKDVAIAINNKNAYRAVGNANNKNKIVLVIPCHRVTASDGGLGGYGAGLWRKEWLLNHEQKLANS